MKKLLMMFLCVSICFTAVSAFADGECSTAYSKYEFMLTTQGRFEKPLNMIIFKDIPQESCESGITAEEALQDGYTLIFVKQYEPFGTHTIKTPLPHDLEDGSIQVFLDGVFSGGYPYINAATIDLQGAVIPQLNKAGNDAAKIYSLVVDNKDILMLDSDYLRFWDQGSAGIFMNYLPIESVDVPGQMLTFEKAFRIATALREINLKENSADISAVLIKNAAELDFDTEKFAAMDERAKGVFTDVLHRADYVKNKMPDLFQEAEIVVACSTAKHSSNLRAAIEENGPYIGIDIKKYTELDKTFSNMMDKIADVRSYQEIRKLFEESNAEAVKEKGESGHISGTDKKGGGGGGRTPNQPLRVDSAEGTEEPSTPDAASLYHDIGDVAWAREAILSLSRKGIVNGVAEGRFNPNAYITRAEFAKLIACTGELELYEKEFADVTKDDWFCQYIGACSEAGIMLGTDNGAMEPDRPITRQDASVMIKRLSDRLHPLPQRTYSFADESRIAVYASEAVQCLAGNGILMGYEDRTFRPDAEITRAESAVVLYRLLNMS